LFFEKISNDDAHGCGAKARHICDFRAALRAARPQQVEYEPPVHGPRGALIDLYQTSASIVYFVTELLHPAPTFV
jgi:hypothetical protein